MQLAMNLSHRAERTRAAILEAAEQIFASRGYEATRLEDVAQQVGIRRASIIYYFRDKPELYDSVLEEVFRGLFERIEQTLLGETALAQRMEAAISAWIDYVGTRPSFARLLLREVVRVDPDSPSPVLRHARPLLELIQRVRAERGEGRPILSDTVDPLHFASAIAGATLLYVAAMPSLVPQLGFDALNPERLAMHREEVLRITRCLISASD